MNKYIYLSSLLLCLFFFSCNNKPETTSQSLEEGFVNIPDSIQTSVYWYWISDHISEEGVVKDLHAMKKAGINRAFIGNIGLSADPSVTGKVKFRSEEWWKILHAALKTATELNIEIGIFNSPGWSQSGGPWVKPNQSMRYLASSTTTIEGGKKVDITLAKPEGDFQDVKVIAFPAINTEGSLLSIQDVAITSTPSISGLNNLIDKNKNTELFFPKGVKEFSLNFTINKPFTLRTLTIYPSHRPINSAAKLQVKENGDYKTISEFYIDRFHDEPNVGFDPYAPIVISVPETQIKDVRLIVSDIAENSGIKEIEFSSIPSIERYLEKTLTKMHQTPLPYWHEYQWRDQLLTDDSSLTVDPAKVVDISQCLSGDKLLWDAPDGRWTIMRTGMCPTGVTNAPASPEATGLETDKMSKEHIEAHFDAYLGEIIRRIPEQDRKTWKVVVQDSYETGGQNFTDTFIEDFKQRYDYDPVPFLPVYSGMVVMNEEISNRFLWDVRRLVADKVAYDYVGGLRKVCHKYGLRTWLENYGHWGFPGEFLQYGGQSDEIGGEFWGEGDLGDIENRAASSCGHIYGKTKISAESFTTAGNTFGRYPAMIKQRGDRFFSEGINNTLLHVYIQQPYEDKKPGVNAWFGTEFNRHNTWFSHIDLFTSYLKRVNYMLQQGLNVADVAYFIGEDAPKMTGITDPSLPKGYQFDYINAEVIEKNMTVKDGLLTLPHGTQYKILVLPKLKTMRPEFLKKIKQLIEDGAVVLGPRPERSPSFQNYPKADAEVAELSQSLWGRIDSDTKYAKIGKGILINDMSMEDALALVKCAPDCQTQPNDPILYNHRTVNGMEIYFVSNQSNERINVAPELRVGGLQPELWEPTTGIIRKLPEYTLTDTGIKIPLMLESYESVFIVFRNKIDESVISSGDKKNYPQPTIVTELNGQWSITFDKASGCDITLKTDKLTDLSQNENPSIKYYAGEIMYQTEFHIENKPAGRLFLKLNGVSVMAKVNINGKYAGGVWTSPYKVDITDYVISGKNDIEIEVVNTWQNRLIGDLSLPEDQRSTWILTHSLKATDPLQKSGITGTVCIESIEY
ncbi:glycoside hydrolase family 2 [Dysgonomonas sp. 521]|uniref:glycosyl hydrolase n=1 Tax=Dysgonomonas sp. 521 TaxID=2302932 RepID=UPI0013D8B3A4|nr:glycosyl hydrolase [Dysgonomonas sp. 521]NDV93978.1 glycoside hydrolase family 2 [Dysgonomonas sp. 521]